MTPDERALLATHVMGWHEENYPGLSLPMWCDDEPIQQILENGDILGRHYGTVDDWRPDEDDKQAMMLLERTRKYLLWDVILVLPAWPSEACGCNLNRYNHEHKIENIWGRADTPATAIANACLQVAKQMKKGASE